MSQQSSFDALDPLHYQAIVAEAGAYLDRLASPLPAVARPLFDRLTQGEFCRIVALLPYWLADLVPTPPEVCHRLGLAHLYFWWYYYVQDGLLDGGLPPAALLSGHLALLQMVETYAGLGVTGDPGWSDYLRQAEVSAAAHAVELQTRFSRLDELTPAHLERLTLDFIAGRIAPLFFNTQAQFYLAGLSPADPRRDDLPAVLRALFLARQLGDDASDWLEDLQAGQLNYVSAQLLRQFWQERPMPAGGVALEQLTGYQLSAESFWQSLAENTLAFSRQALDRLAPYGDCRLRGLVEQQIAEHADLWAAQRRYRANLRRLFGV